MKEKIWKFIKNMAPLMVSTIIVVGCSWIMGALSDQENLSLPTIASMETGIPGTVVALGALEIDEGGGTLTDDREAEGTNHLRIVAVKLDGKSGTRWALIDENCAIPKPGTRVTVEITMLNSMGEKIGWKARNNPAVLTSVECR